MMIPIPPEDIREVPTSVLAYVGDAVYELYVRMHIVSRFGGQSGVLHKKAVHYVSAPAQAQAIRVLHDDLSEEEQNVLSSPSWKRTNKGESRCDLECLDRKARDRIETI